MPSPARFIDSARLIAALTLASRLLGLVRECVFSYYFSTSQLLSAFRIAFMAPNLARRLFGEGALSAAMIPVLTETIHTRGEEASRRFVGSLMTLLVVILGAVVLVTEVGLMVWRSIRDDPALELLAILMPYMPLICLVAVGGGVLNVRYHFAVPAATPLILNIGIILAALIAGAGAGWSGVPLMRAICFAVLAAGVAQLVVTALALRAISFTPLLGRGWKEPQILAMASLMGPMVLGLSAVQINSLMDYLIAYLFIIEGGERVGPAVLGYAHYLYQLPLGVAGIAFATAIFPVLSRRAAEGDRDGLAETLAIGIRLSLFVALPASAGLMFVARPLVATLFERGEFDAADTRRVASTLFFYSIGLAAYFSHHLLVRAFYALKDSKTPARIALSMVALNVTMNLALVLPLQERGLALATAVCAFIQVGWLSIRLARVLPQIAWRNIGRGVIKMTCATAVMIGMLLAVIAWMPTTVPLLSHPGARLGVLVVAGALTYGVAARLLRLKELGMVLGRRDPFDRGDAE